MVGECALMNILLLIGGAVLVGLSIWRRRGRSGGRGWASGLHNRQAWLFFLPGFGLILVAAAVVLLGQASETMAVTVVGSFILLIGAAISLWGGLFIPPPMWFLPAWLRPVVIREREERRQLREEKRRKRKSGS